MRELPLEGAVLNSLKLVNPTLRLSSINQRLSGRATLSWETGNPYSTLRRPTSSSPSGARGDAALRRDGRGHGPRRRSQDQRHPSQSTTVSKTSGRTSRSGSQGGADTRALPDQSGYAQAPREPHQRQDRSEGLREGSRRSSPAQEDAPKALEKALWGALSESSRVRGEDQGPQSDPGAAGHEGQRPRGHQAERAVRGPHGVRHGARPARKVSSTLAPVLASTASAGSSGGSCPSRASAAEAQPGRLREAGFLVRRQVPDRALRRGHVHAPARQRLRASVTFSLSSAPTRSGRDRSSRAVPTCSSTGFATH